MNAALNCLQDISTVQVDSRDLNVVLFFESFGKKEKKVDPSDFEISRVFLLLKIAGVGSAT